MSRNCNTSLLIFVTESGGTRGGLKS